MSFTVSLNRVQLDFVAMPELELTLPQAVRLWALGADDCRAVLDTLVDSGFLRWTPRRTVVRNGRVPHRIDVTAIVDGFVDSERRYDVSVSNW